MARMSTEKKAHRRITLTKQLTNDDNDEVHEPQAGCWCPACTNQSPEAVDSDSESNEVEREDAIDTLPDLPEAQYTPQTTTRKKKATAQARILSVLNRKTPRRSST